MSDTTPSELTKGLKARHLTMMAIGGVIGAGFFLGAGAAINTAGPAVILCYLLGGIVTLLVMMMLTEMAVGMPVAGSFQKYATITMGPWAGFVTGWTYWLAFLIGPASECIAAGTFLNLWFPHIPIWVFCLVVAILLTIVNIIGVTFFGEMEFWLSLIKVVALVAFIIWGAAAITGITPHTDVTLANMTNDRGFMPAGIVGLFGAMMMVIFSFGGTEAIGTAAEESAHPEQDLPKVLRSTLLRIIVLYVLSIAVLVCVVPWATAGTSSSPFVDAMDILGGPAAANIMNFVVLTAALSCIDTGVYATSRMLFSLSRDGFFPSVFAKLHPTRKVPLAAILVSSCMLFVGVILMVLAPDFAYLWLGSLSGFGFLFAWLMICLSEPGMRKRLEAQGRLLWKVPGNPITQWVAVILIAVIFLGLLTYESGRYILLAGLIWLGLASVYYFAIGRRTYKAQE